MRVVTTPETNKPTSNQPGDAFTGDVVLRKKSGMRLGTARTMATTAASVKDTIAIVLTTPAGMSRAGWSITSLSLQENQSDTRNAVFQITTVRMVNQGRISSTGSLLATIATPPIERS